MGHDAPEFEQFYALIRERQGIIEGVVDRMRGELVCESDTGGPRYHEPQGR